MRLTLADIRQDLARIADLAARLDAEMPEAMRHGGIRMAEVMVADWRQRAACRGQWDIMFRPDRRVARKDGARIAQAKALCASCVVLSACQADAAEAVDIIGRQIGDVVGGRLSDDWGADAGVQVEANGRRNTRARYLALHGETRTR